MMERDEHTGLYLPAGVDPPAPQTGGWPPRIVIPKDVRADEVKVPSIWEYRGFSNTRSRGDTTTGGAD
ncbi:hypothetical protein LCGC14_0878590 [marine sediment metagenome]|uniref:Uncharacterized protein n=1 Tax=marine sediment metagenome TaxID=412755 RepID=A0A0F9S9L1_9ZZZZ